jgi:hypothetical protein
MSSLPQDSSSYEFWEFVSCSQCHQPYLTGDSLPPIPFWLTECGHVICHNHFNSKNCAKCGAQSVQAIPLERDMEKPMADWFCRIPSALDSITYACRFQLETMTSSLRHYKAKYQQHKAMHMQYKRQCNELKSKLSQLQSTQRGHASDIGWHGSSISDTTNHNGKRSMAYPPPTSSSPQTNNMNTSADRLILRREQEAPPLPSRPTTGRTSFQLFAMPTNALGRPSTYKSLENTRLGPPQQQHAIRPPQSSTTPNISSKPFSALQLQPRHGLESTASLAGFISSSRFKPQSGLDVTHQDNNHPHAPRFDRFSLSASNVQATESERGSVTGGNSPPFGGKTQRDGIYTTFARRPNHP